MFAGMSTQNCLHCQLPNGIYEFIFLNNSRQAVDDYLAIMDQYFSAAEQGDLPFPTVYLLIELREVGMPPVAYLSGRYRDLLMSHPGPLISARVAYLYTGGFMISIVRAFLALLPERYQVERRFYHVSDRPQAEAWLLDHPESTPTA